jgi:hypothetical protein
VSGRLVSAVLESALPAWLKIYAVAFASFAADDGARVFPTQARIARMVSKSDRQVRRAVTDLVTRQILEVIAPSGRATATRYHFHAERLPVGGDGEQLPLSFNISVFPQRKAIDSGSKTRFPQFPQQLTGHGCPGIPDMGVRRSVNRSVKYSTYTRARARTGTKGI